MTLITKSEDLMAVSVRQGVEFAGYEIVGRVVLMDKDSGRIFR